MAGEAALDSTIAIDLLRNDHIAWEKVSQLEKIYLPCPVLGELLYGAAKSANPEKNRFAILNFVSECSIIFHDLQTCENYAEIKNNLRARGTIIPENDIWIASCIIHKNLRLLTRDKHFQNIAGLNIELW